MGAMALGEITAWTESPIPVTMIKEGDFWRVTTVDPRPAGAEPDALFEPSKKLWLSTSHVWADEMLNPVDNLGPLFWDTETTGTGKSAEIISIGVVNIFGETCFESLIRPERTIRLLATEVHGITQEMLAAAPTFSMVYFELCNLLWGRTWVIYNAPFDTRLLDQTCLRYGFGPILSAGVHCAMEHFARYNGEWDMKYQHFTSKPLEFAAERFGIQNEKAHSALSDALTTWKVVRALAEAK
jgi:DNA polymerase III alpha subunit (gram-positive type)